MLSACVLDGLERVVPWNTQAYPAPFSASVDVAHGWPVLSCPGVRPPMWPTPSMLFHTMMLPQLQMRFLEIPLCIVTPGPSAGRSWLVSCFVQRLLDSLPLSPLCHPVPKVPLSGSWVTRPAVDTKLPCRKRDS